MQRRKGSGSDKGKPEEGRKDNSSHAAAVKCSLSTVSPPCIVPTHGNGDERGEPEDHGDELDGSDGKLVRKTWEARRDEEEICDSEQRPERAEEHEVDAGRRPVVAIGTVKRIDEICCQAQHDNGKHDLHAAKAEYNSWSDHVGVVMLHGNGKQGC